MVTQFAEVLAPKPQQRGTVELNLASDAVLDSWVESVAGLVMPGLEVHRLGRPDAEQHAQDFPIANPLRQRWVEARAALFDRREVKARGVGDRLQMVLGLEVGI